MKASTLFSVTVALFLGLAVAVGAKYSGLFSPKPPTLQQPPPPKAKVLVASKNLFEGYTIGPTDVAIRDMTAEEEAFYREHKEQFMPPKIEAAALRTLNRSVEADQPILRDYLDEINLPQAISRRLSSPSMRAVNITLPPERAAGGLIARGEFVDVNLTTRIFVAGKPRSFSTTETATIARNLKVIVKRNQLWNQLAPVDPQKPITFTLEANVYRAALIEYAKTKGDLTLVPTATPPDTKGSRSLSSGSQSDPSSKEYANEDERIAAMQRGEYAVGDADLERIFNLKPPESPNYKAPGQIEQWAGTRFRGNQTFGVGEGRGNSSPIRPNTGQANNYSFGPLNSKPDSGGFYDDGGYGDARNQGLLTLPGSATQLQQSQLQPGTNGPR
jgi:Flp pilus assembly protein CpaB